MNNDNMAQCLRALRRDEKEKLKRCDEIKHCNHLFVKLKEGETFVGFHASDYEREPSIVECVHCGLTNKFKRMEEIFAEKDDKWLMEIIYGVHYDKESVETKLMRKVSREGYRRGGKWFEDRALNLMSEEVLSTHHATLLYKIAKTLNEKGTDEELFEIMKNLHELETASEKLKLSSIEDAKELIDRYKKTKRLRIIKGGNKNGRNTQ